MSYRKAISCFKELADRKLVWEQRQGRGLAEPHLSWRKWRWTKRRPTLMTARRFPRSPDLQKLHFWMRMTMQPRRRIAAKRRTALPETKHEDAAADTGCKTCGIVHIKTLPEPHVLNCQSRTSAGAGTAYQDLPEPHTSKKDKSKKEYKNTDDKDPTVPRADDGRGAIAAILQQCELSRYDPEEAAVSAMLFAGCTTAAGCSLAPAPTRRDMSVRRSGG